MRSEIRPPLLEGEQDFAGRRQKNTLPIMQLCLSTVSWLSREKLKTNHKPTSRTAPGSRALMTGHQPWRRTAPWKQTLGPGPREALAGRCLRGVGKGERRKPIKRTLSGKRLL